MKRNGLLMIGLLVCSVLLAQQHAGKNKALPDHLKVQFAGGIGFVSVGAGYESKNQKWEGDLYYGYVPEKVGGVRIHAVTGKVTLFPLHKINYKSLQVKPVSVGLLVNYAFGKQYFFTDPDHYSFHFYGFPTAAHAGAFVGSQVNKMCRHNKLFNRIGFYYELGTTDKELISFLNNLRSLKVLDILQLGLGLKASF